MLWIAAAVAVASAVLGHLAAVKLNTNTAGTMSVVVGLFYLAAVFFSPRYGILSTLARNLRTSLRIVCEDLLGMLYRLEELSVEQPLQRRQATQAVGGGLLARLGLHWLLHRGDARMDRGQLHLTDTGRRQAQQLVRSHRLWEAYLVQYLGLPLDHVHEPATRMEHFIDKDLQKRLTTEVAETTTDPHGREIPGPS